MDARVERAQALHWEIIELRSRGAARAALPKLRDMARLHQEIARDRLATGDAEGLPDLYAAITAWAEAGDQQDALRLVCQGRDFAARLSSGRENVAAELDRLKIWVLELQVVPSLRPLGRTLPALGSAPAA